jgi:hypothetical protein
MGSVSVAMFDNNDEAKVAAGVEEKLKVGLRY